MMITKNNQIICNSKVVTQARETKRRSKNKRIEEKRYGISSQTIGASVLSVHGASVFEVVAE